MRTSMPGRAATNPSSRGISHSDARHGVVVKERNARRQGLYHLGAALLASKAPMLALTRRWGAVLRPDPEDTNVPMGTLRCG